MTPLLCFAVAVVAGTLGLFIGCAARMGAIADLHDALARAESEIARLRERA